MPIELKPDHQRHFMNTICTGIVTIDEITHYLKTAWLKPETYGFNELVDYSKADLSQLNYSELLQAAQEAAKMYTLDPKSKCAILISTKEHKDLADFYINAKKVLTKPSRGIQSFESRDEAMDWLNQKQPKKVTLVS